MDRRTFLAAAFGTPALAALVIACGDDSTTPLRPRNTGDSVPGADGSTTSSPSTSLAPSVPGIPHPTGADDVVLRFGYEGGFVAPDTLFDRTPALLISGDGRVFSSGVVPAVFPGPLVQVMDVRSISEQGMQAVLSAAVAADLLRTPPSYDLPSGVGIADAADTVVTFAAKGAVFEHRAYALDVTASDGVAETSPRSVLTKFVAKLGDLPAMVGAGQLGAEAAFAPAAYRVRATADQSQPSTDQPAPTLVAWPTEVGVALKDATGCVRVDATKVADLFAKANQLTYFTEAGITYRLAVAPVLPGDPAC